MSSNNLQLEQDAQSILEGNFDFILDQIVNSDKLNNALNNNCLHQCHLCHEEFASTVEYRSHLRLHGHQDVFQCPVCPETHISSSKLWRHIIKLHPATRSSPPRLRSSGSSSSSSSSEGSSSCSPSTRFTCTLCVKDFKHAFNYHLHMLIHLGELPERCRYCPKSFRTRPSLRKHELIHTGVKPHECGECGSKFKTKDELKQHEIRHTTEKPWKCGHCSITFKYQASLKRHVKKGRCLIGKHWCPLEPRKKPSRRNTDKMPKLPLDQDEILHDQPQEDLNSSESNSSSSESSFFLNVSSVDNLISNPTNPPLFCDVFLGSLESSPGNNENSNNNSTKSNNSLFGPSLNSILNLDPLFSF